MQRNIYVIGLLSALLIGCGNSGNVRSDFLPEDASLTDEERVKAPTKECQQESIDLEKKCIEANIQQLSILNLERCGAYQANMGCGDKALFSSRLFRKVSSENLSNMESTGSSLNNNFFIAKEQRCDSTPIGQLTIKELQACTNTLDAVSAFSEIVGTTEGESESE